MEVSSATERLFRGNNISLSLHVLDDPLVDEQKRPLLRLRMKREEVGDAVEVLEELAASAAVAAASSSPVGTWHENRQKRLYSPDGGCFVRKVGQIFRMFPQHAFCARSLADSIPDDCVGAESSTLTAFILGEKRKETIKWLGVESAVQVKLNLDSCLRGLGGSGGSRGGGSGRRGGRRRGEAGGERGEVLEVEPELVLVESVKIVWVSLRLIYFRT